jgi:hypothetical protein
MKLICRIINEAKKKVLTALHIQWTILLYRTVKQRSLVYSVLASLCLHSTFARGRRGLPSFTMFIQSANALAENGALVHRQHCSHCKSRQKIINYNYKNYKYVLKTCLNWCHIQVGSDFTRAKQTKLRKQKHQLMTSDSVELDWLRTIASHNH